jgi:hypothetical protein
MVIIKAKRIFFSIFSKEKAIVRVVLLGSACA